MKVQITDDGYLKCPKDGKLHVLPLCMGCSLLNDIGFENDVVLCNSEESQ